jgi:NAD(P)-dependent dehydrogenase (short-subunit alcohol dehydrogenase family)
MGGFGGHSLGGKTAIVFGTGPAIGGSIAVLDATEADFRQCFEVNVLAPYRIARTLVPRMRAKGGVFVHCLAAAAFTPILPAVAYGCTKAAKYFMWMAVGSRQPDGDPS